MAFSGAEDGSLDFRLLRQAGSRKVDADVKADCFRPEMFFRLVEEILRPERARKRVL